MNSDWDCIVVGGGAAGLSAALVLGRARKRTLVLDTGRQSNLSAEGVGGLLGHNGVPPGELYAAGRRELGELPNVEVRDAEAVGAGRDGDAFAIELAGGALERGRRVLLATGMDYRYAEVPGAAERWGQSVFHCPFCHGWEVRDRKLGVLDSTAHRALLLRGWSDDVTLYTNGSSELDEDGAARLAEAGVEVDDRAIAGLRGPGEGLEAIAFEDGEDRACEALLVAVTLHQRTSLAQELGVRLAEDGKLVVDAIEVDSTFETSVEGVFAAGDVSVKMPSVATAIAAGSVAAAGIVHSLI